MFKKFLKDLVVSVDGAVGAVIMGMDGIPVDEYCERPDSDLQLVGIESATLLKEMNRASDSMECGLLREAVMVNEQQTLVVRKINEDYFVVLILNGNGNLGKGRFKLRMFVPKVIQEFV